MKSTNIENTEQKSVYYEFVTLIFIIGLFCIDFFPNFGALEIIEPQFLYFSIINLLIGIYIYKTPVLFTQDVVSIIKKSHLITIYFIFIFFCWLSLFSTHNFSVSIISWIRLATIFCLCINLIILFRNSLGIFDKVITVISIVVCLQALFELFNLIEVSSISSISNALENLKGNTGNKNIFASSLCVKIPFVLFLFISNSKWRKWFSLIVLFLASLCIFLTTSRATFIGLTLEIILFSLGYCFIFKRNNLKVLYSIYIVLIISFGFSYLILSNSDNNSHKQTVIGRLANVNEDASANARLTLWNNALKISHDYPLQGIGLGNWKVELLGYEKYLFSGTNISSHAHNDFLEIVAETGYINGIIFCTLFIIIIIINFKKINAKYDIRTRKMAGLVLIVFVGYTVDTLFNFPLYRPTMQLLFCLCIVLTVVNTNTLIPTKEISVKLISKLGCIISIILSMCCIYFNYSSFKASQLEQKIVSDQTLNANDILHDIPMYPNLGIYGFPFVEYLGIKYYVDNNYDKAIKYFKLSEKLNPYSDSDYYQASIFYKIGQIDSAYNYIKKSIFKRPKYDEYFKKYLEIAKTKKDTIGILKIHAKYDEHTKSPNNWVLTSISLYEAKYDINKIISFLNEGLKEYPNDFSIAQQKLIFRAQNYSVRRDYKSAINVYKEILKRDPENMLMIQNIGVCYYNLEYFKESMDYLLKTISTPSLAKKSNELVEAIKLKINIKE